MSQNKGNIPMTMNLTYAEKDALGELFTTMTRSNNLAYKFKKTRQNTLRALKHFLHINMNIMRFPQLSR